MAKHTKSRRAMLTTLGAAATALGAAATALGARSAAAEDAPRRPLALT